VHLQQQQQQQQPHPPPSSPVLLGTGQPHPRRAQQAARRSVAHNDCIARLVKSVRLAEAGRSALLGGWALLGRPPTRAG
jgi:hypothetical protein